MRVKGEPDLLLESKANKDSKRGEHLLTAHGLGVILSTDSSSAAIRRAVSLRSRSGESGPVSELSSEEPAPSRDLVGLFQTPLLIPERV